MSRYATLPTPEPCGCNSATCPLDVHGRPPTPHGGGSKAPVAPTLRRIPRVARDRVFSFSFSQHQIHGARLVRTLLASCWQPRLVVDAFDARYKSSLDYFPERVIRRAIPPPPPRLIAMPPPVLTLSVRSQAAHRAPHGAHGVAWENLRAQAYQPAQPAARKQRE